MASNGRLKIKVFAGGELLRARAGDHHGVRGHHALRRDGLLAAHVDDGGGRGQDRVGAQHRAASDMHALDDDGKGAGLGDRSRVLDDAPAGAVGPRGADGAPLGAERAGANHGERGLLGPGAAVLQIPDLAGAGPEGLSASVLLIGGVAAGVTGVLAIRTFVAMLASRSFHFFAPYCWVVGVLYLAFLSVR